jgi:anti-sigma regulatory factor (Ser/Thr protein kinase)
MLPTTTMGACLRLTMPSDPCWLPVVRAAANQLAVQEGFDPVEAHELALALDEALANVIKHGYQGAADRPIEVHLRPLEQPAGRRGIEVLVRDFGRQVDPASIRPRDLDEVRPGGLGVHLIKSLMDEAEYTRPDCGMLLRMVKYAKRRLPAEPDQPAELS